MLSSAPQPSTVAPLDDVFRQYSSYVAAIALRILGRRADADDVVQDVFLAAARHLGQLREAGALKGWLATTTVRAARRKLRTRQLRRFIGLTDDPDEAPVSFEASPEQRALLTSVYKRLDTLRPRPRAAWILRYVDGHRLEDVAVLCECSLATVKRDVATAAAALKDLVDEV